MLAIVCLSFSTSLEPPATVADVQGAGSGGGVATHYSLHADDVGTTNWHISFCKVFVIMHSKTIVFVRFS